MSDKFKAGDRVKVVKLIGRWSLCYDSIVKNAVGKVFAVDRSFDNYVVLKDMPAELEWCPEELEHVNRQLTFTFTE